MNISQLQINEIKKKSKELDDVKPLLKKKFIGIDSAIDRIIDYMRPYYIFSDSLKRPLVINLWGMTGTGKTSLLQMMCEKLNLNDRVMKIDVGDYATAFSDWKMKNDFKEKYDTTQLNNPVIIFDEFQFGRTINEKGEEVDRTTLRPMWEVIDSGCLYVEEYKSNRSLLKYVKELQQGLQKGIKVDTNGVITEGLDQYFKIFKKGLSDLYLSLSDFYHIDFEKLAKVDKKREILNINYHYYLDEEEREKYKNRKDIPEKVIARILQENANLFETDLDLSSSEDSAIIMSSLKNYNPDIPSIFESSESAGEKIFKEDDEDSIDEYFMSKNIGTVNHSIKKGSQSPTPGRVNNNNNTSNNTSTSTDSLEDFGLYGLRFFITSLYWKIYRNEDEFFSSFDRMENMKEIWEMNPEVFLHMIYNQIILKSGSIKKLDMSQALIFCVGNIDEAYRMSHSSNPDADADLFYEHSLKITVPQMKNALTSRFRMEQIGRLGNNHVVYPSISSQSYRDIIKLYFDQRVEDIKERFGVEVVIDDTMLDLMYKESVFPSQGARPVLSSFNTLIDSYTALIITHIIDVDIKIDRIKWAFKDYDNVKTTEAFYVIDFYKGDEHVDTIELPVKLNIDSLRKSDSSNLQAQVAVHEAGHAIACIFLMKMVPKEIVSKTASNAEGFVMIDEPEMKTKEYYQANIAMALAGVLAEQMVFGEDNTSAGCSSDLSQATDLAGDMVKNFGMANKLFRNARSYESDQSGWIVRHSKEELDVEMVAILEEAKDRAVACLQDHEEIFIRLAHHMSTSSKMVQEELLQMINEYYPDYKPLSKDSYHDFKTVLNTKFENIKA